MDFVGRYERLQEDFDEACRRIGIPPRKLPEKRKAKDRGAYREYYDDETAEMVARHFRRDIEEFGYRFDPAELYDIGEDPYMTGNLCEKHPEVVQLCDHLMTD